MAASDSSSSPRSCVLDYCESGHYGRGYCRPHYDQIARGQDPRPISEYTDEVGMCAADGCSETFRQRSRGSKRRFCSRRCHHVTTRAERRARPGWVEPRQRPGARRCSLEGCEKPHIARGYCSMHLERVRKCGDPGSVESKQRPGEWQRTADGYMARSLNGERQIQHRYVMELHLSRPLWPDESVHHKNGDRADNRLENLELWSKYQPAGQRVADKLAWAREIIARYGGMDTA